MKNKLWFRVSLSALVCVSVVALLKLASWLLIQSNPEDAHVISTFITFLVVPVTLFFSVKIYNDLRQGLGE